MEKYDVNHVTLGEIGRHVTPASRKVQTVSTLRIRSGKIPVFQQENGTAVWEKEKMTLSNAGLPDDLPDEKFENRLFSDEDAG
uniref:Uncharacterized protein n=1 Tax=Romanomermis culicivorax TaxID=13658 RepID=A0A915HXC4_ROMCU